VSFPIGGGRVADRVPRKGGVDPNVVLRTLSDPLEARLQPALRRLSRRRWIVAATHHYWSHVHSLKAIGSSLLATVLWPLILIGINLHIH